MSENHALEFAATTGKWRLEGTDLVKFDESGEMIEFEGHDPPDQGAGRTGRRNREPDRPPLGQWKELADTRADFVRFWRLCRPSARLRGRRPCGKDRRAL